MNSLLKILDFLSCTSFYLSYLILISFSKILLQLFLSTSLLIKRQLLLFNKEGTAIKYLTDYKKPFGSKRSKYSKEIDFIKRSTGVI